jgi:uncharacterized membrane protein YgcG
MSHDTFRPSARLRSMTTTLFYALLAAGALVIAPAARLIPTGRDALSMPAAMFVALIYAGIGGTVAVQWFEAQNSIGVLGALAFIPVFIVLAARSSGAGPSQWWSTSDSSDCGDGGGDGGGGDGGGCD